MEEADRKMIAKGALPDFLVIGAQKAGTTYLYQNLLQHPLVYGSYEREVSFFSTNASQGGEREYRKHFPPRWKLPRGSVVGEKSPGYLNSPDAAERAARVIPRAKVLVLLRNPVDRTYSNYQHLATKVGADPLSFEEALEANRPQRRYAYLSRGLYADHLPAWNERFETLVIQSEEMYEHPRRVLKRTCEFVGVAWQPEAFTLNARGKKMNRNSGRYTEPTMKPETRKRLEEYFEPHNQRLYDYLGRKFNW